MAELRVVDGFYFSSEEEYQKALREQKAISYLKQQMSGKDAKGILTLYQQMLDQKLFSTPVGISFLHDLNVSLRRQGSVSGVQIPPISFGTGGGASIGDISGDAASVGPEDAAEKKDTKKLSAANRSLVRRIKNLRIVTAVLLAVVVAMFLITATSNHPTILNYEQKIQDKYASWEQSLTEREAAVMKREAELRQSR